MVTSVRGGRRPGVWKRALIVMLSISLIGALGVPGTAGAATPLPAPTNLVPNGGTFGPTPTLSWSPVPGADHYQVTFPNHQGSVQTTYIWGTSYVPVDDFPPGPVSWSVAAVDRSNNVGAVANATFTNASVNAPTLTCPGSTVNFPAQAPTLTWTPIRGVRNYTLLVSSTPTFVPASTITLTTQATSYTLTKGIPTSTVYYAQVSGATGSGINTGTSATCQFTVVWSQGTTGVNDAIPNYLSPANGASVRNVQLEWSPLKGAARYEVQISPNGDWTNNLLYDIVTDASVWSPAKTLDNGSYYWRVRGIDNEGNFSRWSDYPSTTGSAWQFTVTPLATPAPTAPAANAIVPLPNLLMSWNPSPGAGAYQIELSSTSSFSTSVTCFTTQTDWSPYVVPQMNPPAPQVSGPVVNQPGCVGGANNGALWPVLTSGTIYWHVRALDDLVPNDGPNSALFTSTNQPPRKAYVSTWSAPQLFFTNQTAATLVSPAPSATVAVPTMSWTAVPGAVFYQVSVTSWYWGWNSNTNQCTAPGPGGGSQRSYNTAALSLTPSLVAVPRPSTNPQCPVNVSWTVTPYSFTANAGQLNNYIPGPTPTARTFTWSGYQAGAGSTPNPIGPSPANNATVLATQIPTFSWTPVTGADHYQVWWYANPALSTYVPLQDLNVGNGMNDPVTESFTPVQPLPVGQGAWQIVALDSNNNVISSGPKETLNVASPPNVPANSIQFTSKTMAGTTSTCNSGCQIPATPLITWGAVPGVTNYRVYIAQDPNFTNVVRIYDTATTSLRSVEALPDNQAGQSYYVSVQPVLADWYTGPSSTGAIYGNFGASVDPTGLGAFKKASSAVASPRTVGPAQTGGACNASAVSSISDMPTFCWNAATPYASGDVGAMSYHIQVATTPDFSNIIDQAWVDQPTYTPYVWPANVYGDGGYFPGSWPNGIRDLTYPDGMLYWRVQAIDSTGNPLTYSAVASVTKSSTGITMTGPANGATVPQTTSLSWTPKTFAAQYEVQVAKAGDINFSSVNVVFDQTTDLTAVTPSANNSFNGGTSLPAGTYAWRVRSVDAGRQVGGWTVPWTFTVQPSAPSLTSPANNASFTSTNGLSFSWSPVAGAVYYVIYVSTNPTPTTNSYISVGTISTGWSFSQPPATGRQYWTVLAFDGNQQLLAQSPVRSFGFDGTRPSITNLSVTGVGGNEVDLAWTATANSINPITNYQVSMYSPPNAATPTTTITIGATTSYAWTGLMGMTQYAFTVTPVDVNGPGTPSNPVTATTTQSTTAVQSFVKSAYNDFLGYLPSPSQVTAGVSQLGPNPSSTARGAWLQAFATSPTWVNAIVNQFYINTLGRPADAGGLAYWSGQISSGALSVAQVAANFYASNEYFNGIGGGTLTSWVSDLYPKLLGRQPDANGLAYWVGQAGIIGRVNVAYQFYQSPESCRNRVTNLYLKLLQRQPDAGGLAYWAGVVPVQGDIALAVFLASSDEYYSNAQTRFP